MRLQEPVAPPVGWAKPAPVRVTSNPLAATGDFITKTLVVVEMEIRKLRHDPSELVTRALQPVLWMLVFGQVFTQTRAIPTGGLPYIAFMAPGILAQSVLFVSIFYGISIIWDRDAGVVAKFLSSPIPRIALALGKSLSAGVRSLSQAVIIFLLAVLLGVNVNWNPLDLLGILLAVFLGAAFFSAFSLMIACIVKTRERFMGIGQVLTMPLFFASNAIYPISIMPGWLQVISHINPLTYQVDMLRSLMLANYPSSFGIGVDVLVLGAATAIMVYISGRLYPSIVI